MKHATIPDELKSLDERSRDIFRRIVETYLSEGDPVGSANLSRQLPQSLSPATIRTIMSDLEHLGLIYSPHISAGRMIPFPEALFQASLDHLTRLWQNLYKRKEIRPLKEYDETRRHSG